MLNVTEVNGHFLPFLGVKLDIVQIAPCNQVFNVTLRDMVAISVIKPNKALSTAYLKRCSVLTQLSTGLWSLEYTENSGGEPTQLWGRHCLL